MGNTRLGVAAIACYGLSKTFPVVDHKSAWRLIFSDTTQAGTFSALDQVSLSVPKGEVLGILGTNGAGKSTLLRILGNIYQPTSGTVQLYGDTTGIFELGGTGEPLLTGRQYARRWLTLNSVPPDHIPTLLADIHEFSELQADFDRPIFTYSTGMGARLFFAAATAVRCDIYLIDEALVVGDEHFQGKCWKRIRDRLAEGASGILVTHDWAATLKLCKNACILKNGQVASAGPAQSIVKQYLNLSTQSFTPGAKFADDLAEQFSAKSGTDSKFCFPIEISESVPIVLDYSIEYLEPGVGWEIVLLDSNLAVASCPGSYCFTLNLARLPLAPGHYTLNLFLSSPPDTAGKRLSYDVRSWTYGNQLSLTVTGEPQPGLCVLPITWESVSPEPHDI